MKTEFQTYLVGLGACSEARRWAAGRTAQQAWDECERADWLLWWLDAVGTDRKLLVRIACQCARTALPFVVPGELRPLKAIETAEAWCDGKASIEEVREAANAADAADAAYYAAYAANAAAHSAYTANAAYAANAAAYAAHATADAAYAAHAAANATATDAHISMCGIIRSLATCPK